MSENKMKTHRHTWAEVDLDAVRYNFRQMKKLVGKNASLLVVVKGNAYGHGIFEVSKVLQDIGADFLGVATLDEALFLRKKKINNGILDGIGFFMMFVYLLKNLKLTQ